MWTRVSDAAKKKAKQRGAIEKPKLDNARQLRGAYFIEPDDEEFKLIIKDARRKLEVPMIWKNQHHSSTTFFWVVLKENVQKTVRL